MSKPTPLTFAHLVDWVEGNLSQEEATAVAVQVAQADEKIHAAVAWLQTFVQVSAAAILDSPPPATRDRLIRRFEAYMQDRREPGFLQRLAAALTFDSRLQPGLAGLRATGAQASLRQLIYTTGMADIALNIQPRPGDKRLNVNGQIFPGRGAMPETFSIQLLRGADEVGLTTNDDLGEFSFEAIPAGVYELVLSTAEIEILIKPIELNM